MNRAIEVLKALSDERRLRIAVLLSGRELCVCELVGATSLPQYIVSRSLSGLRKAGIVSTRKEGKWIYYSITSDNTELVDQLTSSLRARFPTPVFDEDSVRLEHRLRFRVDGKCIYGLEVGGCCGVSVSATSAETR